jgi:hypothetical protein
MLLVMMAAPVVAAPCPGVVIVRVRDVVRDRASQVLPLIVAGVQSWVLVAVRLLSTSESFVVYL